MAREFIEVDPATLRLPGARRDGADPFKLQRQFAKYGFALDGMPPLEVMRGSDHELVIFDGVTRATRAAMVSPGNKIAAEVTNTLKVALGGLPTVGDRLRKP